VQPIKHIIEGWVENHMRYPYGRGVTVARGAKVQSMIGLASMSIVVQLFAEPRVSDSLEDSNIRTVCPFTKQETDTLSIVCSPNTLCNNWANVDCLQFCACLLVLFLRDGVGDLSE
jgi:hypothetical protein